MKNSLKVITQQIWPYGRVLFFSILTKQFSSRQASVSCSQDAKDTAPHVISGKELGWNAAQVVTASSTYPQGLGLQGWGKLQPEAALCMV